MAVFDATNMPATARATKIAGLAATTSSAEQLVGNNTIFLIVADVDCTIRFGVTGMSAADTNDMYMPAKVPFKWDLGSQFTAFRVFNNTAGSGNVFYIPISKF